MDSFDFETEFTLTESPNGAAPPGDPAPSRPWYDPRRYFRKDDDGEGIEKGDYAIGLYDEGHFLHVVVVRKHGELLELVEAQRYRLGHPLETVTSLDELIVEVDGSDGGFADPLDLGDALDSTPALVDLTLESDSGDDGSAPGFHELIRRYAGAGSQVSIALAEPSVYYVHIDRRIDGKPGKAATEQMLSDISEQRPYADKLFPDQLHAIPLADGRTTMVVREARLNHADLLEEIRPGISRRIRFVESAESSILNLAALRYDFADDEVNLVIHVGQEYSRVIFLQGTQLLFLSDKVETYMEGENLANFLNRMIQVEIIKGRFSPPSRVFLSGNAAELQLEAAFRELFTYMPEAEIRFLDYPLFGLTEGDMTASRYSVALGGALRVLNPKAPQITAVDLTPDHIREEQKQFKLNPAGWLLLLLIPLCAAWVAWTTGQQEYDLRKLEDQLAAQQTRLNDLQVVDERVTTQKARMVQFEAALNAAAEMGLGTTPWSDRLNSLNRAAADIGGIWLTELKRRNDDEILLFGYATSRTRIAPFVQATGASTLRRVEVQSIRDKAVYFFEIELERHGQ